MAAKSTASEETEKWVRHDIIALWDGQPYASGDSPGRDKNMAECDRIMIALYRFQTDGKVSYRRLVGMHGGGGGTKSEEFKSLLETKMNKDIDDHYPGGFPDKGYWPNPVPNSPTPVQVGGDHPDKCFAYTFCWHGQPEFLLWHRPLMAEFERGLQDHDPKFDGLEPSDPTRHTGSNALGCPYWGWEGWDGLTLPQVLSNSFYVVKTNKWKDSGFPKGSSFRNPFHRWLAPVSIEHQREEVFDDTLTDYNTTTRAAAFEDPGAEFANPWPQVSATNNPSMRDVVIRAMYTPNWQKFCTTKFGGNWSIENPHNKFHNHVGGLVKGGVQGSGVQHDPTTGGEFTGTMAQNQSIFDPIFWLHHGNVERQLISWQRRFMNVPVPYDISKPSTEQMAVVLYPWTKPDNLFNGELSWNTQAGEGKDGSFGDWWEYKTLPYKYDQYLEPPLPEQKQTSKKYSAILPNVVPPVPEDTSIYMVVSIDPELYRGGEYTLWQGSKLLGTIGILSAVGSTCPRCAGREVAEIRFDVSDSFESEEEAKQVEKESLKLTRNGNEIPIEKVSVVTE